MPHIAVQVYLSATPAGTSVRNMRHWGQNIRRNVFSMYDYDIPGANWHYYGSTKPPAYDLSKMTVPTALFSGEDLRSCGETSGY